jgi:hypothetical protein
MGPNTKKNWPADSLSQYNLNLNFSSVEGIIRDLDVELRSLWSRVAVAEARGQFGNPEEWGTSADGSPYQSAGEEIVHREDSVSAAVCEK